MTDADPTLESLVEVLCEHYIGTGLPAVLVPEYADCAASEVRKGTIAFLVWLPCTISCCGAATNLHLSAFASHSDATAANAQTGVPSPGWGRSRTMNGGTA